MFCAQCGVQTTVDARFCVACGASVSPDAKTPLDAPRRRPVAPAAVAGGFRRYFQFSGRARRQEYWGFVAFAFLLGIVCVIIDQSIDPASIERGVGTLQVVCILTLAVPATAVLVRRLHDAEFSGWLALLLLLPVVGVLALLILALIDGTVGPNRYGPDPKGRPNPTARQS